MQAMLGQLNYWAALPEIVILASASLILLVDLFVPEARRHVSYWLTQLALLIAICVTLTTLRLDTITGYHGMIVDDMLADFLRIACFIAVSLMLFYSRDYMIARGLFRGDVFVLTLFALLGMQVMITGNNFLTLYIGLELMSLSLYALVAARRDHPRGAEASMKYFVLGALASGMLLYGLSMIYGTTGSLDLQTVARAIYGRHESSLLLTFGLVFVVSGLAFKLAVVPYHMWVPDVYDGAPTSMTVLIGTAPKIAAFAMSLRILSGAMQGAAFDWQGMLIVLCVLSMVLGNLVAIAQANLKRMLAYSTIANMGYMLLGFLTANRYGFSAAMFYTVSYALTSLASFGMIMLLSRQGFESDRLDDFRGLNQRSPWWAFIMLLVMFSLAGLPPTLGFYAKFMVIESAINEGFVWLAVVAVVTSLIGAFYYLRVVKLMYFDDPRETAPIAVRGDTWIALSANGLLLLILGVLPQQLMGLCAIALTQSNFP
ncbi:MAG TPA: NADH-quinone oxidoreductase subunit NuoN [Casimicrobiaceae bacterium]|nr:NADH-quinone oxidoreductase subunit NuoN [Casimicrobiaceae bacterium]